MCFIDQDNSFLVYKQKSYVGPRNIYEYNYYATFHHIYIRIGIFWKYNFRAIWKMSKLFAYVWKSFLSEAKIYYIFLRFENNLKLLTEIYKLLPYLYASLLKPRKMVMNREIIFRNRMWGWRLTYIELIEKIKQIKGNHQKKRIKFVNTSMSEKLMRKLHNKQYLYLLSDFIYSNGYFSVNSFSFPLKKLDMIRN